MSWYMPVSLLVGSPAASPASRMLFSIICRNSASTCSDTALTVAAEAGAFLSAASAFKSV